MQSIIYPLAPLRDHMAALETRSLYGRPVTYPLRATSTRGPTVSHWLHRFGEESFGP